MGNTIPAACARPWFRWARRLEYVQAAWHVCSSCKSPNGIMCPPSNTTMIYGRCQDFAKTRQVVEMDHCGRWFQRRKRKQSGGVCGVEPTQPQRICHGWKGLKHPALLHVGNGRPYGIRILQSPLTGVSIVIHCFVLLFYTCHSIVDELISPCSKVSVIFACKFPYFAFASVLIVCGGDVKQGEAPL